MAYAFVQQKSATTGSATSLATGNFASNITAGNLIWVVCTVGSAVTPNTPTDTIGHTYTLLGSTAGSGVAKTHHWYAKNTSSGTNSVTVTTSGGPDRMDIAAYEWSGFDTSAPLLGNNQQWINPGTGSADSVVSGNATVTTTGAGVLGFDLDINGRTLTNPGDGGTGFTELAAGAFLFGMAEHKRITADGTYNATFDDPAFDQHNCMMAIFSEPLTAFVSNVTPRKFYDAQTGILVAGTTFGAAQGSGKVWISPSDNVSDGSRVEQTVTAWADTSITITSVRGALSMATQLYLFVVENGGTSNATGYPVEFITSASLAWTKG